MDKALWHINPLQSELRDVTSQPEGEDVEVRSLYSLVSNGTEALVARGEVGVDFMPFMAVPYMEGDFNLPIKYGYSMIGQREDNGKYVHFMHPHQSRCWVKEEALTVLPSDLPLEKAALISNMETVINAIWDAEIQGGEKVLIAGFGNIGALLAETLSHQAVDIYILEKDTWRKNKAQEFGFNIFDDEKDFDLAFDTTASSSGLQLCIDGIRTEGCVINLSWYGDKKISLNLGSSFHYGRKKMIASQVSSIPLRKQREWTYASRKKLVMDLLVQHPYEKYISDFIPFLESPLFFENLRKGKQGDGLIWCIDF